ncbi:hypothetical protein [uncultured Adlercreutzia sp.]|uniref:anti-sigma-I factor RsgI family protein n=1 Tax=uncultured Adlercreutzia sp. TaxID=875803 RepID=UPI0025ECB2D3|nr:hypothetical protein [uncultured Adlercreutzia sp.]MCI9261997.1 hypothetical protein [Eggerthellaceae bacterium]
MTHPTNDHFEHDVREALLQVKAPASAKTHTLAAIEAARAAGAAGTAAPSTPDPAAAAPATSDPAATSNPAAAILAIPVPANSPSPVAPAARSPRRRRRWAPLAAAACLLLVGILAGAGWHLWQQPAAFVGVDVNPSLELTVNAFDRVVKATAINDDGAAVLDALSLEGRSYAEAFAALMDSEAMAPYLAKDAFVDVNITTQDNALASELQAQSDAVLAGHPYQGACHHADEATREAAAAAGMGVGRYRAACELAELDDSVSVDDCAAMTMRELHDAIDHLCEDESHNHGSGSDNDAGHGAGTGSGQGSGAGNGAGNGQGVGSGHGKRHGQHHQE